MADTVDIGWLQLGLATSFILFNGFVSLLLSLGLVKSLLIAMLRTYVQLLLLGWLLGWLFNTDQAFVVVAVLLFMTSMTARLVLQRVKHQPPGLAQTTWVSVMLSTFVVTFCVTNIVVQVSPWYDARYVITIGGMVLGNSMNGIALSLERLFDDLDKRRAEINQLLALGATPWEASLSSIRTALNAGLMPTINSMSAVGLVFIPGMMTGQLLAGADPITAAKYQIVVMLMISAATGIGAMTSVYWGYRYGFDKLDTLRVY